LTKSCALRWNIKREIPPKPKKMAYILYTTVFVLLVLSTAIYLLRSHLTPYLPFSISHLYQRVPSSFASDIESGLSSTSFNLHTNLSADDPRAGLDDAAKKEIQKIMKRKRVNFDEARRLYTVERFRKNGIGEDGRSLDPKAVSFS